MSKQGRLDCRKCAYNGLKLQEHPKTSLEHNESYVPQGQTRQHHVPTGVWQPFRLQPDPDAGDALIYSKCALQFDDKLPVIL